jgi:3-isopropylmalate/(R)-2-methylmalate dehydratase large subunit
MSSPRTLYDKIWDSHVIEDKGDGFALLYVDRHIVDEHSSAQAFDGLRASGRKVRRTDATLAVPDHNVPTLGRLNGIADARSRFQIETLQRNAAQFGVLYFGLDDERQGISHVVGPEQGFIQPGMIAVCGDSHASTYGALGALGLGIGTSDVEHVMASQTLIAKRSKTMRVILNGNIGTGVSAKDLILAMIGHIGAAGALGHVIRRPRDREAFDRKPHDHRQHVC